MKLSTATRLLTQPEIDLAREVFQNTLPAWKLIGIRDGLGLGDAPWTDNGLLFDPKLGFVGYQIMLGSLFKGELTARTGYGGYGRIRDIFIHEMTHVWQYHRGDWVKSSAIGARIWEEVGVSFSFDFSKGTIKTTTSDEAYSYTVGKPWKDYNVEEQATIVEEWYSSEPSRWTRSPGGNASPNDVRFPYIDTVIRKGGGWGMLLPLEKLKTWDGRSVPAEFKAVAKFVSP
jgi:hypothetical protein